MSFKKNQYCVFSGPPLTHVSLMDQSERNSMGALAPTMPFDGKTEDVHQPSQNKSDSRGSPTTLDHLNSAIANLKYV